MSTRLAWFLLPGLLAAAPLGCVTLDESRQADRIRERAESDRVEQNLARLQERVDALERAREQILGEIETLRKGLGSDWAAAQDRITRMESALKEAEVSRQKERQGLTEAITRKLSEWTSSQPPRGAASASPSRYQEGLEHVVKAGETLSAIAAAYKVKPEAIVKANSLKDPHRLRVGQRLFIPE
jgi:LysM repeat protein